MTKSFFQYPTGTVGWALLLLRCSVAAALAAGAAISAVPWIEAPVLLVAAALILGVLTRAAGLAGLVAAGLIGAEIGGTAGLAVGLHGIAALALSMIGAGGYSIDARRFGRRVITLD
ncbi:hypothetical protein SAMN06295912_104102 [Sphingomonas laterariae]|uniref:Uncharacterized protein n=1 Tax=Edaphosphingomonas laterariae TaxID=861865 RepID=A0A239DI52_9SPHN|nr:hypothetical protein [Sphingomonas laterariae]SNS31662.1 hypothetical protein SAMN06295912_104102 [Sphingomonas laterariae]